MTLRQHTVPASRPGAAEECSLTAADGKARSPAMSALFAALADQRTTDRGTEFVFRGDPAALWEQVSTFVAEESGCCPFYAYEMIEEPDGVRLLVSRPLLKIEGL